MPNSKVQARACLKCSRNCVKNASITLLKSTKLLAKLSADKKKTLSSMRGLSTTTRSAEHSGYSALCSHCLIHAHPSLGTREFEASCIDERCRPRSPLPISTILDHHRGDRSVC